MARKERVADHGPEELHALRHSTAHVMAGAVLELFPEARFGFGPPVRDGFYYDFDLPRALTPDDLAGVEERMRDAVRRDLPFEHDEMSIEEAKRFFGERGQVYKIDQIDNLDETVGEKTVSIYRHGDFVDLCRGPHVPRTGAIGPFKLLSIAGAYWRGDEHKTQLQRVYGTVWPTKAELDAYLARLAEIERRDHRVLGRDLELFRVDEELGSGLVLWLPNLSVVREELESWWRRLHRDRGYELVYTPHIASARIYQRSGHLEKYGKDNMYGPLLLDEGQNEFWIKPMNCPGHVKVYQSRVRSYRELPLRIGELGTVYRYERGGTLHGMLRVRGFTQDDSHIFCRWDQAQEEIGKVFDLAMEFLAVFGYRDVSIYLSTRPEKRLGSDEMWDKAEEALRQALGIREVPYEIDEGGGVFYAPKIDIKVKDAIGREWQGATVQIDLNLPERFDVSYVNDRGERERAVMIHRVLFGSLERFVGGLIEHFAGAFPLWLSWEQAAVIPANPAGIEYAREVTDALRARGFRVHFDEHGGDMRAQIKSAQGRKANYMLVVGAREAEARTVAVRRRGGRDVEQGVPLADLIARLEEERATRALPHDFSAALAEPSVAATVGRE
ncbi:MAG TPA: threonine--tRNA ligase [Candidatus Limnocylindrales bacterium]|nr:threonine--tRNA ligase [Candidatus Limnocylindrales bacterium]